MSAGLTQRDAQAELFLVDFGIAKELIMVLQTFWQNKGCQLGFVAHQFNFIAIKIIAFADLPVQFEIRSLLLEIEVKSLINRNKLWVDRFIEQGSLRVKRQEKKTEKQ